MLLLLLEASFASDIAEVAEGGILRGVRISDRVQLASELRKAPRMPARSRWRDWHPRAPGHVSLRL